MIVSYIPVLGTAVSFLLNATVDLVQGQNISSAVIDAIGHALPGQPIAGAAFEVVRGLVNGDSVESITVDASLAPLGVDSNTRKGIKQAVVIVEAIASGQPITKIIVDAIYEQMPDLGKHAMDIARDVLDGKNVIGLVIGEATQAVANAANAAGDAAKQRFIAEAGYHGAINAMSEELRNALVSAIVAGRVETQLPERQAEKLAQGGFDTKERDTGGSLDRLAAKGRLIMSSPQATYRGMQLMTLHDGATVTVTMPGFDALSNRATPAVATKFQVTPGFRRGFEVGVGAYEGVRREDAEKQDPNNPNSLIRSEVSLNETDAKNGFRVAREIQFERTKTQNSMSKLIAFPVKQASNTSRLLGMLSPANPVTQDKNIHVVAQFQESYVKPVAQQKKEDLAQWIAYYTSLG